eukprot:5727843-Ditylum_brightwellii.AAC.1
MTTCVDENDNNLVCKATPISRGRLLPSSNLKQGSLSVDNTTRTSYAPPQQMLHHPSTSSPYCFLTMELLKSGSSSSMGYR